MSDTSELASVYCVNVNDVGSGKYEAKVDHYFGIGAHCGSSNLSMHLARIEPGNVSRAHLHLDSDIAMYVISGEATLVTWDANHERTERVMRKGDFVFLPRGTIHKDYNYSNEPVEVVTAYHNGTGPETLKVFVENQA